ncbi:hypothetical protein DSM100685_1418 [Bifidobacterium avesanii]|nr:hypothetical protein DSM100685_1418 [Bifidobacterium avesanii]
MVQVGETARHESLRADHEKGVGLGELVRRTRLYRMRAPVLYQMRTRSDGSSHMPSPGFTSNASANRSTFLAMPLVRHSAGE